MQVTVEQSQSQRVELHVHTDVHDGVQARIRVDGIRAVSVAYVGSTRFSSVRREYPWSARNNSTLESSGVRGKTHTSWEYLVEYPLEALVASGTRRSSR